MTDGYIAIMRHEAEEKGLSPTKGQEHKSLGPTAYKGDGLTLCQKVSCYPGHSGEDGHYVHEVELLSRKYIGAWGPASSWMRRISRIFPTRATEKRVEMATKRTVSN